MISTRDAIKNGQARFEARRYVESGEAKRDADAREAIRQAEADARADAAKASHAKYKAKTDEILATFKARNDASKAEWDAKRRQILWGAR
jgi:hypothetical protein